MAKPIPISLSFIVPITVGDTSVERLVTHLAQTMEEACIRYELLFLVNGLSQGEKRSLEKLRNQYPFSCVFREADKNIIRTAVIKSQFPTLVVARTPDDLFSLLPFLLSSLSKLEAAHIVSLQEKPIAWLKKMEALFERSFARSILGLKESPNAALYLFRREAIKYVSIGKKSDYEAFASEFLFRAKQSGFTLKHGVAQTGIKKRGRPLRSLKHIFRYLSLRFRPLPPVNFDDQTQSQMLGSGTFLEGKKFVTHTDLHHRESAILTLHRPQKRLMILLSTLFISAFLFDWRLSLIICVAVLTALYFIDLCFNFFLVVRSFHHSSEVKITEKEVAALRDEELPLYTIFCPLYKEWKVIPQFTKAMESLDWPKNRLEIQLLLEADDTQSIEAVAKLGLPEYFRAIIVPEGEPKTKPKACNYGLNHARGEYAVIYDAEDMPEPDQLKKAYLVFQKKQHERIVCAQAKLNFYNSKQNILTRLFAAEYSLWFDLTLTGLQSTKSPIPLGGTSNHFRTRDLKLLQGWDPFNVTEDCDLGMRIAKLGYHTAVFDSMTYEEANSEWGNWLRQRSRWIKGYMQTYLVHMRRPGEFSATFSNPHILTFQIVVGGKILSLLINPFMWILTIAYFSFRSFLGPIIDPFFPGPILYMAVFSLVFGNFLYLYYYMIGAAKREEWDIIPYVLLVPFYWLMMSVAIWKALKQLITHPHYWEKTEHGFHLEEETFPNRIPESAARTAVHAKP